MRKTALLVFVLLRVIIISAQPNSGFESWSTEFSYEVPDGWQTLNFLSLTSPPNPLSAFKAIGADKHSGNYALKLKSVYLNNNTFGGPLALGDTTGGTYTGKINLTPLSFHFGFPYTSRPSYLNFWAKYFPVDNDTAIALVVLKRWTSNGPDTIGVGGLKILSTSSYSLFQVPISYLTGDIPDSATIGFAPSHNNAFARVNSTLFIDDIELTGWVGFDENAKSPRSVRVFPNPAKNSITFDISHEEAEMICIYDVFGKLMIVKPVLSQKTPVNTFHFAGGTYFYEIKNKSGQVLFRERFCITQ